MTWNATEVECAKRLKADGTQLVAGIESCQLAFRFVCSSSPYLPEESDLELHRHSVRFDPAERLDQETVPTQAELRLYKKRQLKIAANDMVYGQIPNTDATERADSDRRELMGFVKELREMMRTDMARDEGRVLQTQDTIRDTADYERELREKLRAEIQEEMRAEMQEQIRASVHEQIRAETILRSSAITTTSGFN